MIADTPTFPWYWNLAWELGLFSVFLAWGRWSLRSYVREQIDERLSAHTATLADIQRNVQFMAGRFAERDAR